MPDMSNPNDAPMPGDWVPCEEGEEEFVPGWDAQQKQLLPDEETPGPVHPEVPDQFQYVYKQSLVSFFERYFQSISIIL